MTEIRVRVSLVPNLLMHSIIALELEPKWISNLKPAYRDIYTNWALDSEKESLKDLGFAIEGISSNVRFALLYQIPAYFAQDTIQSLISTIYRLVSKDLESFLEDYPEKRKNLFSYVPFEFIPTVWGEDCFHLQTYSEDLRNYARAVEKIFYREYQNKWKKIKTNLQDVKKELTTQCFQDIDWIGKWEEFTNITFPYDTFDVELIDSLTTYGTSILAEKDGFYAFGPEKLLVSMISHEIGTHILFNTYTLKNKGVDKLIQQNVETFFTANELLAWSINMHFLQDLKKESKRYEKIFSSLEPMKSKIQEMVQANKEKEIQVLLKNSFEIMNEGLEKTRE